MKKFLKYILLNWLVYYDEMNSSKNFLNLHELLYY